ncbi:MAG TPA: hypothetical protein VF069_19525 [Streptosporangiaceae bacterium]
MKNASAPSSPRRSPAGEGTQNLLRAYLAGGVLIGLLANTVFAWWRLTPPSP